MKDNKSFLCSLLLFLTAIIWGAAFVAQSTGMDNVGPYTFICIRFFLGALVLLPFIISGDIKNHTKNAWKEKTLIIGGISCGFFLFTASTAQQIGIITTTVGKSGFITAFYIVMVPIFSIFLKKKPGKLIWVSIVLGVIGLYLLCITKESLSLAIGDIYLFACAILFSFQIICVDFFAPKVDCLKMACLQFTTTGFLSIIPMIFEKPTMANISGAWLSIFYAGIFSSGIAYTLQIVAQKHVKSSVASLIMSLESVFAVIFGFLLLHQKLSLREGLGCVIMFAAVILAQFEPQSSDSKA